jgi:hypothetical protein
MNLPSSGVGATETHARLLMDSFKKWTRQELVEVNPGESMLKQLFYAPKIILSHGTEADPILNYGNQAALQLWEMDWNTLTQTPSRLTAEPMEREERERFFKIVTTDGFVDNYTGTRISNSGRRFYIVNATVWNVIDSEGRYRGQAAAFTDYRYI